MANTSAAGPLLIMLGSDFWNFGDVVFLNIINSWIICNDMNIFNSMFDELLF